MFRPSFGGVAYPMCSCSGPTSPLATYMQAYSGTEAAQEKAKDKNHDGIVEADEKSQASSPSYKAPGTATVLDITA